MYEKERKMMKRLSERRKGQPRQKEMTASFIHIVNIPY